MPTIIVVRHGEVLNPNHVVYADLPGFDLSPIGVQEAHQLGKHLASLQVDMVLSSPLARAEHTASAISVHHSGVGVSIDHRLTETRMYPAWTGMTWEDVERRFPRDLRAYLADATMLSDTAESVFDVATRVRSSVKDAIAEGHEIIVVVGHQDPTQALRLSLVGRSLSDLRRDPPRHASATTITSHDGVTFTEVSTWNPEILQS